MNRVLVCQRTVSSLKPASFRGDTQHLHRGMRAREGPMSLSCADALRRSRGHQRSLRDRAEAHNPAKNLGYCFTKVTGTTTTALPPSGGENWAALARA